jgi:hypothetical protein
MFITNLFVDRPWCVIFTGIAIFAFFTYLAVAFKTYLPSPVTNRDFLDYNDENTKLFDAREAAMGEI